MAFFYDILSRLRQVEIRLGPQIYQGEFCVEQENIDIVYDFCFS